MAVQSLTRVIGAVLDARIDRGLRRAVLAMIPQDSGDLRASVRIFVRERFKRLELHVNMLGYAQSVDARGVPGKLFPAVQRLMLQEARAAAVEGTRIWTLQVLGLWEIPLQRQFQGNPLGAVRASVRVFQLNRGRVAVDSPVGVEVRAESALAEVAERYVRRSVDLSCDPMSSAQKRDTNRDNRSHGVATSCWHYSCYI